MNQLELYHDDIYSALRSVVEALGGAKRVGHDLWPSKTVKDAERRLLNSLNPEHDQKLDPQELVQILLWGREQGIHCGAAYLMQTLSYEPPKPITPEQRQAAACEQYAKVRSEVAALARQFGYRVEDAK